MTEIVVINSGPLIMLSRIDALEIASQLPVAFIGIVPCLLPLVQRLVEQGGRYSKTLLKRFLHEFGE